MTPTISTNTRADGRKLL